MKERQWRKKKKNEESWETIMEENPKHPRYKPWGSEEKYEEKDTKEAHLISKPGEEA